MFEQNELNLFFDAVFNRILYTFFTASMISIEIWCNPFHKFIFYYYIGLFFYYIYSQIFASVFSSCIEFRSDSFLIVDSSSFIKFYFWLKKRWFERKNIYQSQISYISFLRKCCILLHWLLVSVLFLANNTKSSMKVKMEILASLKFRYFNHNILIMESIIRLKRSNESPYLTSCNSINESLFLQDIIVLQFLYISSIYFLIVCGIPFCLKHSSSVHNMKTC